MAPSVPKASRTRRNIGRGYGPKVNHHGEPGISWKFNNLRHLWPAPRRPYGILATHKGTWGLFVRSRRLHLPARDRLCRHSEHRSSLALCQAEETPDAQDPEALLR